MVLASKGDDNCLGNSYNVCDQKTVPMEECPQSMVVISQKSVKLGLNPVSLPNKRGDD